MCEIYFSTSSLYSYIQYDEGERENEVYFMECERHPRMC